MVARFILKNILPDKTLQESAIMKAGESSGLTWTILRPPMLVPAAPTGVYTVWSGLKPPHKVKWKVAKADVAAEALRCIETGDHAGEGLQISW